MELDVSVGETNVDAALGPDVAGFVHHDHVGGILIAHHLRGLDVDVTGLKAGAFDYLTKPVETEQLAGKLRQAMELAQSRRKSECEAAFRRQMADRLSAAERLASLGTLATGVAHEINNPLAIIQESAGWLAGKLAKDADLTDDTRRAAEMALDKIKAGVDRARRITHQLLELAKKNQWDVVRELDAAEVLAEAVEMVRPIASGRKVEMETRTCGPGPAMWSDPEALRRILVNLLTNAAQASPEGGRVSAEVSDDGGEALFVVKDHGPGIPRENQSRIFEPFYTTKPPGQGTGLGLSVCQGLAERMGGQIEVDSRLGAGAAFRLRMPKQPPAPEQVAGQTASAQALAEEA